MFGLRVLFDPVGVTRLVDAGQVFCPVRGRNLDVDRCGGCAYLDGVVEHGEDSPSEIRCQIPLAVLTRGDD